MHNFKCILEVHSVNGIGIKRVCMLVVYMKKKKTYSQVVQMGLKLQNTEKETRENINNQNIIKLQSFKVL